MTSGLLRGVALLATGRGRGIHLFGDTPQAFLASLAPLLAFPFVGASFLVLSGQVGPGLLALVWSAVTLVAPPVVSHALAVRWGREAFWLRYATAFNWCQWAVPVAGFAMVVLIQLLVGGRETQEEMAELVVLGIAAYFLWLHWMVARSGLELSRLRAVALVLLVNAATAALVIVPQVISRVVQ